MRSSPPDRTRCSSFSQSPCSTRRQTGHLVQPVTPVTPPVTRCQFILESYYIDDVDARKLAAWLNISPDSVHRAIKRCRDGLRAVLADMRAPGSQVSTSKINQHNSY
jgi:hypothetical protein